MAFSSKTVIHFPEESGWKKTTQQQINANVPAQCVLIGYLLLGGLPHNPMSALCLQLTWGAPHMTNNLFNKSSEVCGNFHQLNVLLSGYKVKPSRASTAKKHPSSRSAKCWVEIDNQVSCKQTGSAIDMTIFPLPALHNQQIPNIKRGVWWLAVLSFPGRDSAWSW